jgi:predicted nucleotidyltransferase
MDIDSIAIANEYLKEVRRLGIKVDKAYLFGSYAKGKVWEGSDLDICIISSTFGKDYHNDKMLLNKAALRVNLLIEPVAYSPADFANKYDSLAVEIRRFGISII